MAMIMLKKNGGGKPILVTQSAYNNFYGKSSTWIKVDETGSPIITPPSPAVTGFAQEDTQDMKANEQEESVNTLTEEELLEIPVTEMTKAQVREAARIIGFDYKAAGLKKLPAVREALAKKLAER